MIGKLADWLDDRTGYRQLLREVLYEPVPGGARWQYVWGSTLVFTFFVQVVTGFFLWSAYSPSTQTAWESVYFIEYEMFLGSIVRGMHHYAAQAMIVLLAAHLIQVIWAGAYRAPRELNFWLGLILAQIVLGLSLTGYLLPWDQKGYYATQVSTKIMGATPVVGPYAQQLAQGGSAYGHHTLTRFFAMHAGLLPAALVGFLGIHIYVFRRHGITVKDPQRAPQTTFWPDQVLKDAVACLGVLAVVLALAVFRGAELSAPANPSEAYAAARPEWYFLSIFRFLKFEFVEHFGIAFGALYVPGMVMGVLIMMPIIAGVFGGWGHKFNLAFVALLSLAIVGLTGLAMFEDANNPGHQAAVAEASRHAERIVELAAGSEKIPASGAVELLRHDPFTQGPRVFAKYCSSCHRYNGHDGRGRLLTMAAAETGQVSLLPPTAADLGDFASRTWMRAVVVDFAGLLRAVPEGPLQPSESEMADWSGDRESLISEENQEKLAALVEFMVSEAGHPHTQIDQALAEQGKAVAVDGDWNGSLHGTSCVDCHTTMGEPYEEGSSDDSGYCNIAKYGSTDWLRSFVRDPGTEQHYGDENQMPAFGEKMTAAELEMLVAWMTGDYAASEVTPYPSQREKIDVLLNQN